MDTNQNNFDKEFSLNKNRKTKPARGKIPPWLLILAGTAVIGGAIAARQPAINLTDTGTRTTVNLPASQMVSGNQLAFNAVNDEQVSSSELEAHLINQEEQGQAQQLLTPESVIAPTPTVQENVLVLQPQQNTQEESEQISATAESIETDKSYENAAIAWLNEKAYSVTVKPGTEAETQTAEPESRQSDSENLPVTVLDQDGNEKKQPQTTNFEINGKDYTLQLTELSPSEIPAETSARPVVWIDTTPLEVTLSSDPAAITEIPENESEAVPHTEQPIEISLSSLPDDLTKTLQQERFGDEFIKPEPTATVITEPTATPIPEVTEEPQEENWFASFFHNIFGGDPTATPTPQVTVIAVSPTPTLPQPTATPIVIRMESTAALQGPIRLDGETDILEPTAAVTEDITAASKTLTENDEAENESSEPQTKAAPSKIEAVVVESFDDVKSPEQTVEQKPAELPHTGGLEGWNIPSLLAMLAGLLLVIIGVRRLRSKEK